MCILSITMRPQRGTDSILTPLHPHIVSRPPFTSSRASRANLIPPAPSAAHRDWRVPPGRRPIHQGVSVSSRVLGPSPPALIQSPLLPPVDNVKFTCPYSLATTAAKYNTIQKSYTFIGNSLWWCRQSQYSIQNTRSVSYIIHYNVLYMKSESWGTNIKHTGLPTVVYRYTYDHHIVTHTSLRVCAVWPTIVWSSNVTNSSLLGPPILFNNRKVT